MSVKCHAILDAAWWAARACRWVVAVLSLAHASAAAGILPPICGVLTTLPCAGDCDGNGNVEIDDLLDAVKVGLGERGVDSCLGGDVDRDGHIRIDELLRAVGTALRGCVRSTECSVGAVTVSLGEQLDWVGFTGPHLFVHVSTVEFFPCANYSIEGGIGVESSTVRVVLRDIRPPFICLTAFGPASFRAELALGEGEYALELETGDDVDTYDLSLTPTHIELRPVEASFSSAPRPLTPRIPRDVVVVRCFRNQWGDEDPATRVDELCPLLFGSVEAIASPAVGVDPSELPIHCEPEHYASGECRAYVYTGELATLVRVVEEARQHPLPHGHRDAQGRELYYSLVVTWLGHML